MKKEESIKVEDRMGFIHEVSITHTPSWGFSTAYDGPHIIAQCELGKIREPFSDDDAEWERYEESFGEWRDAMVHNLQISAREYFNKQL